MWNTWKIVVLAVGMSLAAPVALAGPLDEPTSVADPTQTLDDCIIISPNKSPPVAIVPC